jgi:TetR/AcrR family transcriptional repressor of nem operon
MVSSDPDRLTPKGRATRARIVEAAADLVYEHGVRNTNNEMIRRAAGISGSQLSHYFADKQQLVLAVIERRVDAMRGQLSTPPRGPLDSMAALNRWAEDYTADPTAVAGGCGFGSLAAEILKSEPTLRDAIADGFRLWADDFRHGLNAMKRDGTLRPDTEIETLVHALTASFQGGVLLTQIEGDIAPLRDALNTALAAVRDAST